MIRPESVVHVAEPVRIEALEELRCVGPRDDQLPEGGDVDHADGAVHGLHLGLDVAVGVRPLPRPRPHHVAAELLVPVVDG
jgi:hypothetical protein